MSALVTHLMAALAHDSYLMNTSKDGYFSFGLMGHFVCSCKVISSKEQVSF